MRTSLENKTLYLECNAEIEETWAEHPPRTEECHGYHTFDESELIDEKITEVSIILDAETKIDITSRLTKEELELILKQ
jgi:hypothetical protein